MSAQPGTLLWSPPLDGTSALEQFAAAHGHADYDSLWKWSVTNLEEFWAAVWDWCDVLGSYDRVLSSHEMPGARWFEGAELNYAEHALRGVGSIIGRSQTRSRVELSADDLRDRVAACRTGLQRLGVGVGDRVVAFLPNIPEAVVAYLATASLGAIWASAGPELGPQAVIDRFGQVEPKVLIAVDGYVYGKESIDRSTEVAAIAAGLPTLEHVVTVPYLGTEGNWSDLLAETGPLEFTKVPFDHPLHVLFSSGATGLPKAIVHSHTGIVVEHLKLLKFHFDLSPEDRLLWYTTTGWMMWNVLVSGLLTGATIVTFDGDPGSEQNRAVWRAVAEEAVTYFGTSAPFLMNCRRAGVEPGTEFDLGALRAVGSTGAPLPADGFHWVYEHVKHDVLLSSSSGGTETCSGFVGANPTSTVRAGEISDRYLGAAVQAVDGELILAEPMPSMPIRLWGDEDDTRYREEYFSQRPGSWTHGDLLEFTPSGGLIISGRSDATLNRGGVRIGTSEVYRVVEGMDWVTNSLIVHHEDGDRLVLFVSTDGTVPEREISTKLKQVLKAQLSPRHVPNEVYLVGSIPVTLSGKKLEVPVKKILAGAEPSSVARRTELTEPESLDAIVEIAAARNRRLRWDEASRAFTGADAPRPVSQRREELLEIAAELFAQQGFAVATVDSLGAAAGVSGPALYHHFANKEAMLGEMLVGTSHHLLANARVLRDSVAPDRLLEELIAARVDFAVDHRALISVEYRDLNSATPDDQERVRVLQQQYLDIWVDAATEHRPDLTPMLARAAVHAVLGLINSTPFSPDTPLTTMVSLLRSMAIAAFDAVLAGEAVESNR